MKVFIPTLKRTDHSAGCVYADVYAFRALFWGEPHEDLRKSQYQIERFDGLHKLYNKGADGSISFSAEKIHEQHHYFGKKKAFLESRKIASVAGGVVLTPIDGGIFLSMVRK